MSRAPHRLGRADGRLFAVLLAGLTLTGCAQAPDAEPVPAASPPTVSIVDDRPDESFGAVVTGPAVGPDLDATTAAPPKLVAGEWWRIAFTSRTYEVYETSEVVRVVAAVEPDQYLIGMPHEGWFKEAIAYHAPAFGDVAFDLSYAVHNERFEPVRFPLVEGATWETTFATQRIPSPPTRSSGRWASPGWANSSSRTTRASTRS